jgi:L-ascorbate metabolism protein UlaG (beta-lactamase superfamily)
MKAQSLIPAVCSGRKLQEQIKEAKASPHADRFDIWWLGQSGFLIQWNGKCILFDPYLSDSLTKKYSGTSKPHVRMSEQVILPEWLDLVDIVTSSHNHTDHLDAETLIPLLAVNPTIDFVIPEANRIFVCDRIKCAVEYPIGLNAGEHITLESFEIHGVPAAHNTIERNEKGQCRFMGFVVTFGKWTIYHSGDTLWYEEMIPLLKPYNINVAFLPINGNDPTRGVAGNLNASEAVQIAKQLDSRVIPHHYHMFEFNTVEPGEFIELATAEKVKFNVMKLGEHLIVQ